MRYIKPEGFDAAFHFSVETYFLEKAPLDAPIFMIWQSKPCTMLGRFQVAQAEVDHSYAKQEDIHIVRRPSGGGTIFVDHGTLLYSLILPLKDGAADAEESRKFFATSVATALRQLGIPAEAEGRNDILVDGKKIAGIAQHMKNGWICTHGSLLFDTDLDMLTRVLTPDDEKIKSKAIRSVRSRVTNLSEYLPQPKTVEEFWVLLEQTLQAQWGFSEQALSEEERIAIQEIHREKFGNPEWTFGNTPKFSFQNSKRFPAGKVDVFVNTDRNLMTSVAIFGDFLGMVPIRGLEQMLENQPFTWEAISSVLEGVDLTPYLGGVTKEQLLECLFEA